MIARAAMNLFDPESVMELRLGGAYDMWFRDGLRVKRKAPAISVLRTAVDQRIEHPTNYGNGRGFESRQRYAH
jgi:hypothetical protein